MKNPHELLRENKQEILPILNDKQVIKALCQFLGCSQNFLKETLRERLMPTTQGIVTLKGEDVERPLQQGYFSFNIPKNTDLNEYRTISAPSVGLKTIQLNLLQALRNVPISTAAQGGELGTSPKKNALHHRQSKYLYTTDIKSAYPSVSAQRIHKNLEGGLGKIVDMSFPYLTTEQRSMFFDVLTTLLSHNDALPQGSPTSARMLNIAMAKTDKDIINLLNAEDSLVTKPVYTRYIDDIAISFEHFAAFDTFAQTAHEKIKACDEILAQFQDQTIEDDGLLKKIQHVGTSSLLFMIGTLQQKGSLDDSSIRRMRNAFLIIKEKFEQIRDSAFIAQQEPFEKEHLYNIVGEINGYLSSINKREPVSLLLPLQEQIKKTVNANGRTLKMSKEKTRDPTSSRAKEITGVMIGKDGRLGISQTKMAAYTAFAKQVALHPSTLSTKFLQSGGVVNPLKVAHTLHGIRNFIMDVKGHVPAYFDKRFNAAQAKYFPDVKVGKGVMAMKGASNGGVI